jgi:hypothetical protein
MVLKKGIRVGNGLISGKIGGWLFEYSNDPMGFIKSTEFLDYLRHYYFLKNDCSMELLFHIMTLQAGDRIIQISH